MSEVKIDLQKAMEIIKDEISDLQLLYIFGSYASGNIGPNSDIDFAFLSDFEVKPLKKFELQEKLARFYKKNVDLIDMSKAGLMTIAQILHKGERIFEREKLAADEYEMRMVSNYYSYKDDIKPILDQIKKEGRIYG